MRLLNRVKQYAGELRFAFRATQTLGDGLNLAARTLLFHLSNGTGWRGEKDVRFGLRLSLPHTMARVTLRQHAGDLFIFYEVLMQECYALPQRLCDPREVRTVIDCGANVGLTSLYFADRYPSAAIFAIEAHPANYALLKDNVAHEPRVIPIWGCVVGRTAGPCYISTDQPAWGNSVNRAGAGVAVPAVGLYALCERYAIERIDLLKVDIEGAEKEVFADPGFLARTRLIVIELHGNYDMARFQEDLTPYRFRALGPDGQVGNRMVVACHQTLLG